MMVKENIYILPQYRMELAGELSSILDFWINNMMDEKQGGFFGSLDNNNLANHGAEKGIVLNSRILWTFSAAYARFNEPQYLDMAARAYKYIIDHFIDRKYGGVYWSVDHTGKMLNGRKQIYGLAFCIYGLTEYYKASNDIVALHIAQNLYEHIEQYSFDRENGGYLEAFTQGWKIIDDMRLSEKDDNEKKTMNTHLHIIEAYANLYTAWPEKKLKESIRHLLDVFEEHFIDKRSYHLNLFMDDQWNVRSSLISYGHDIEAAWLLLDCAEKTESAGYTSRYKELGVKIAEAATEGLAEDGGLWYEYDPAGNRLVKEKHSWPQAEAMIGLMNAYQLTGEEKYLHRSFGAWNFIKKHIKDARNGEWFWGVKADYSVMQKEKAGFWKCPYHNARACMEVIRRITNEINCK